MIALILGLGNPGERYRNTRHNIGFAVAEHLAVRLRLTKQNEQLLYTWTGGNDRFRPVIARPQAFMNRSGLAAKVLLERVGCLPQQMLVVVDDFHLPLGRLRVRRSGSDGGHNGLISVAEQVGTRDFPRLRIGVGPISEDSNVVDFVLGEFDRSEREKLPKILDMAAEATLVTVTGGVQAAMEQFNRPNPA
jgi:PTH1 family peptidyl-tRNA hydrolase